VGDILKTVFSFFNYKTNTMHKTDPGPKQEETNVPAPDETPDAGTETATDDASEIEDESTGDEGEGAE